MVSGQRGLVGSLAAVRDQQDRPPRPPGGRRGDGRGGLRRGPVLPGQPVQDPLGDQQLLPLGLDLLQLFGQLHGQRVQFTPASRDPLQLLHAHALPATSPVPAR